MRIFIFSCLFILIFLSFFLFLFGWWGLLIGVDGFVMDTDGGAPRSHLVIARAVSPCGHTVWSLSLALLEAYSVSLLGSNF